MDIKKELSRLNMLLLEELINLSNDSDELRDILLEVKNSQEDKKTRYKFDQSLVAQWYEVYSTQGEKALRDCFEGVETDLLRKHHNSFCSNRSTSSDRNKLVDNIIRTVSNTLNLGNVFR